MIFKMIFLSTHTISTPHWGNLPEDIISLLLTINSIIMNNKTGELIRPNVTVFMNVLLLPRYIINDNKRIHLFLY